MSKYIIGSTTLTLIALLLYWQFSEPKEKLLPLHRDSVIEAVYGLGQVKTDKRFEVKVGIVTSIKKLFVREGDKVQKNDPLLTLDEIPSFRAPFAGTITSVNQQEEETVFPQVSILVLEDLTDTYIEVSLEQRSILKIKKGMPAILGFEHKTEEEVQGTVSSVFSREGEFIVRIDSMDLPREVLPGMTIDVSFVLGQRDNVLLVPLDGLKNDQVIRVRDGQKKLIDVSIGHKDHRYVEIRQGDLKETDQVIEQR
jgi:multidrug efflux pump subunit AcrA (membrane-fusion protein)